MEWIDPWGLKGVTITRGGLSDPFDYILTLDSSIYPETAQHIKDAINKNHPSILTWWPSGAKQNRKDALLEYLVKLVRIGMSGLWLHFWRVVQALV